MFTRADPHFAARTLGSFRRRHCRTKQQRLWGAIRRRSTAEIARLHARLGTDGRLRPVEGLRTQPGSRQSRRWGHSRVLVALRSADGQHLINSLWQSGR